VRVISKSRLREFWEAPGHGEAERPLTAWYRHISDRTTEWWNWSDLKTAFPSADQVGDCVVFNISGNKYRLIARLRYQSQRVYVLKVMTHKEYDENKWKKECGCFQPAPASRSGMRRR
jgi:mRNA interferase HigB